jgi:hypothetical protein
LALRRVDLDVLLVIDEGDLGAFLGEAIGDATADALRGAGDDGNTVLEPHARSSGFLWF